MSLEKYTGGYSPRSLKHSTTNFGGAETSYGAYFFVYTQRFPRIIMVTKYQKAYNLKTSDFTFESSRFKNKRNFKYNNVPLKKGKMF